MRLIWVYKYTSLRVWKPDFSPKFPKCFLSTKLSFICGERFMHNVYIGIRVMRNRLWQLYNFFILFCKKKRIAVSVKYPFTDKTVPLDSQKAKKIHNICNCDIKLFRNHKSGKNLEFNALLLLISTSKKQSRDVKDV